MKISRFVLEKMNFHCLNTEIVLTKLEDFVLIITPRIKSFKFFLQAFINFLSLHFLA